MTRSELEQAIRTGIPLTRAMDFRVLELGPAHIAVRGGGEENINVHGTAFAGSLYTLCTLAAWGLANSRLPEQAALVMAEGDIRYRRPVTGEIIARSELAPAVMERFLAELERDGRARMDVPVRVDQDDEPAAVFTGRLHARLMK
ncbi:MAG: YiiD C-terminal domain-containing protein [Gammaproteobacteria bacterium]